MPDRSGVRAKAEIWTPGGVIQARGRERQGLEALPLTYFWIVFYRDGSALPQYEADGTEHRYSEIDWGQAVLAGWYPITPVIAEHVPGTRPMCGPGLEMEVIGEPFMVRRTALRYRAGLHAAVEEARRRWYLLGASEREYVALSNDGQVVVPYELISIELRWGRLRPGIEGGRIVWRKNDTGVVNR